METASKMTKATADKHESFESIRNRSFENQTSVGFDGRFLIPGKLVDSPHPDMSLLDAIITRRTSRSYRPEPVPYEVFEWLVNTAAHAPTACNEQKWKVIYIDDRKIFDELYARGSAAFLKNVNQAMIVLYNKQTDNTKYDDHVQSGAAFITTFSFLAHTMGIGSCWIGHIPPRGEIRRMFGIDRCFDPIAVVTFGYYTNKVKPRPRKKQGTELIARNHFTFENLAFHSQKKNVYLRRFLIAVYYAVPPIIRKRLRHLTMPYEKKFYDEVSD